MNCKQGDLAIVVRSLFGNTGKVVTCLNLLPAGYGSYAKELGPIWETDNHNIVSGLMDGTPMRVSNLISDANLRPLRGSDGQDESLTWLDVPSEVPA